MTQTLTSATETVPVSRIDYALMRVEQGVTTIITRQGRVIAKLMPCKEDSSVEASSKETTA